MEDYAAHANPWAKQKAREAIGQGKLNRGSARLITKSRVVSMSKSLQTLASDTFDKAPR
jgi:hypothetical protein